MGSRGEGRAEGTAMAGMGEGEEGVWDHHIHSRYDSSVLLVCFTVCPGQPGCPRENRARLPRITGLVHGKHSSFASHILVADGRFGSQRLVSMRLVQIVVGLFRAECAGPASNDL